jgi:hypothetical protein
MTDFTRIDALKRDTADTRDALIDILTELPVAPQHTDLAFHLRYAQIALDDAVRALADAHHAAQRAAHEAESHA